MRTTLDIDDDVLSASKELAKAAGKTAGQIISELARKALTQPLAALPLTVDEPKPVYGIRPFPRNPNGRLVTSAEIRQMMDDEGI
ncbi:MAG: CopG family transcriptional regulator [Burkholderiales bacterium]|nr:CopG family transcriptional regulator [Burkholderiales bacterium]